MHNPCALIPVYNHEAAVPAVVQSLLNSGLPCLLVDDGSSPACAAVLAQLATLENVTLLTLPNNQGKGGAVMAGFREAARLGLSHVMALQTDASALPLGSWEADAVLGDATCTGLGTLRRSYAARHHAPRQSAP